ncbi:cytochrome-c oxidase, cbb3-type subunit III [Amylibacter sp. SFDW26]|uniref:cytochrome-c oxidase, cbb3-type subunit III n=1 Tax=Amylibacter sp. SFDW26 TaxID=2652722 RepID=UPI0012629CC5|nr:cytochrome-c oxidase, cbb3-type subunit III [Amylibacter sp. SFDW26]KAB7614282.1 cytochrome-c oxidase, cbb3-type subunit III [Amylibacter sp. SFDW26]
MSKKKKLQDEDYPTTGHEWDGIREYDKPMPRWWLWTFYLTIIFSIGYVIAYPAIPLVNSATPGVLKYSTRMEVREHIDAVNAQNAEIEARLLSTPLEQVAADADLSRFATAGGNSVFKTYCAQCHGAGAQGFKGYPNLQDDDWLWGGDLDAIEITIRHGIRHDADDDTRYSEMPKFGEILEEAEIAQLTEYVLSVSSQDHDSSAVVKGQSLFADNCSSCHGETAQGDREQGAPNLADALWLYGGDREAISHTIKNSRFGVMPAWQGRLTEAQIKQVTFYVHQLGGGE